MDMATTSSSSTHAPLPRHLLNMYGTTAAPPPTPSSQSNNHSATTTTTAADTLSRLLHRLPPILSLPTRLSPRPRAAVSTTTTTTTLLPTATSLSHPLTPSTYELGFFQLSPNDSMISSQLGESAELEALALLDLSHDEKVKFFPKEWPLGFDHCDDSDDDDDGGGGDATSSFCLNGACSTTSDGEASPELRLSNLRELTRKLEKLGLEVVESLACAMGFENPFRSKSSNGESIVVPSSLMWISDSGKESRVYPYVVGLQYQIRSQEWSLLSDAGLVIVEPQVGSVLVTVGDIAQVWSNGKLKKVRGRAAAISEDKANSRSVSMTLLLTVPLESTVAPLLMSPVVIEDKVEGEIEACKSANDPEKGKICDHETGEDVEDQRVFNSFSFEDYAWRVYHERLPLKDPLDRYRIGA